MEFIEAKETSNVETNKESVLTRKIRNNPWILTTIVLAILTVLLIFGNSGFESPSLVSEEEVGGILINFFEDQGISGLTVVLVEDVNNFYKVDLEFQDQIVPFYVTKNGYLTGNDITSILPGQYEIFENSFEENSSKSLDVSGNNTF